MFICKLSHVLFLLIFQGYDCGRRIQEGIPVNTPKKYAVYLLKASVSPRYYDGWLCGGALVSEWFIVTSAACVTDVTHLYAIAGYSKYVSDLEIHVDPCTRAKKKKIVFICTPNEYEYNYQDHTKWSFIDIAVVKVESPYDFSDTSYATICSYTPAPISINYDSKYQEPGIDAIVLGWGHRDKYREEMDLRDYNQENLNYAPTLIQTKQACKKGYNIYEGMDLVIDKYMICTHKNGNLDDAGLAILKAQPNAKGCLMREALLGKEMDANCEKEEYEDPMIVSSRKLRRPANITNNDAGQKVYNPNESNNSFVDANSTVDSFLTKNFNKTALKAEKGTPTRRNGICQNDHGGPLVTWVGAHEVLIGVATAFKISESLDCIGPYLYTSTQCSGAFLDCVFREANSPASRREICANLTQQGIKIVETNISWMDHPDGPADNEKNITTHASPANNTNATMHLKNAKGENNVKLENNNSITLVNTNITDTLEDTRTTKAELVGNNTNTSSINDKKSARVILTGAISTNLINKTFTNLTDTKYSDSISTKSQINSSINTIENIITPTLIKNTSTNLLNTSTAKVYLNASTASLIEERTKNLLNYTTLNLYTTTLLSILQNSTTTINQANSNITN